MLRYPCLVLDHDDTAVDSTRTVNYPHFREALAHFRPQMSITLEEYLLYCFDPGFYEMCDSVLHYTPQELEEHVATWKRYHKTHFASFYPGIPELLARQRAEGGLVCVVSHSREDVIAADYVHNQVPLPDLILDAARPPEQRKPNSWPLEEIMRRYSLTPDQLLVVDDMILGGTMARGAGCTFAGAGWCGMLPRIEALMRRSCDVFFSSVAEFSAFLFPETP